MDEYSLTDEATVARISDSRPRALPAYFLCLHNAAPDGSVSFTRDEIMNERMRSWTKFKNDIRSLAGLYVLTFLDKGNEIDIELIPQEGL